MARAAERPAVRGWRRQKTVELIERVEKYERQCGESLENLRARLECEYAIGGGTGETWTMYRRGRRSISEQRYAHVADVYTRRRYPRAPISRLRALSQLASVYRIELSQLHDEGWLLTEQSRARQALNRLYNAAMHGGDSAAERALREVVEHGERLVKKLPY